MNVIELWYRGGNFAQAARDLGHDVLTISDNPRWGADITFEKVNEITGDRIPAKFRNASIVWASPPCNCFTILTRRVYWAKTDLQPAPKRIEAEEAVLNVWETMNAIDEIWPDFFVIENPQGKLRHLDFMQPRPGLNRDTFSHCQYGDTVRKATDVWHNIDGWHPKPCCPPGAPCHNRLKKGPEWTEKYSYSSTSGFLAAKGSSKVPGIRALQPYELMVEILREVEARV